MNAKSLQFSITLFFVSSSIVTFLTLGSYVVYDYHSERKQDLRNSMTVMMEDILHHKLYHLSPDKLKENFHILESYHDAPFVALFDNLNFTYFDQHPEPYADVTIIRTLPDGRYLGLSSSLERVNGKTMLLIGKLGLAFVIIGLLLFTAFTLFLNKLLQPLRCLVNFCQDFSNSKSSLPLCNGSYEVNNLNEAIINLLDANRTICKQKQDIFKEAAHEIKSPLAILKARLSLFKQSQHYEKDQFISETQEDISTISNKLKELLFLKEVEWDMQQLKEQIDIQEQFNIMQQIFQTILEKKGLSIAADDSDSFVILVHKDALQKVMYAIFENIFIHTQNHTIIHTKIDTENKQLHITNEISSSSEETLFSSSIGTQIINRLSDKLDYTYETRHDEHHFHTIITFHNTALLQCSM